ncbi:MAG: c-type cytochrome [Ginsengibacter sp.]
MKKTFIILSSLLVVIGCSDSSDKTTETDKKSTDTVATAAPAAPAAEVKDSEAEKGLGLVAKSDCFTCHKLSETSIGPAYSAVAAKYQGKENIIDSLAQKVIKGGAGVWGTVPMTPHPQISKEDAKTMVHYVMSIK